MNMLYKKRYDTIINYRKENPLYKGNGIYLEEHHIKPRSFFPKGTSSKIINNKDNLVNLTAREHFIAHCFLAKMYDVGSVNWHKMNKAMNNMQGESKKTNQKRYFNSRLYEYIKTKYYKQVNKEHEEITLKHISDICDWIDENNGIKPNKRSKNSIEKKMGIKISHLKQAKKGKGRGKFYKSYQKLVKERGYPNLFDIINFEEEGLIKIKDICDWMDMNNKEIPKQSSKNSIEKKLSLYISRFRSAKQGKEGNFYKSYQELAEERGYPKLFDIKDFEKEGLTEIIKMCDWIDENGRLPLDKSNNNIEKKLGHKIYNLKQSKQGKVGFFYKSYQELVEERGYPNLFDIIDYEKEGLKYINELCNWIDKYNRFPKQNSKIIVEKRLSKKLSMFKQGKHNPKYGINFYDSFQKLAEDRGYPDLFKITRKLKTKF